MITEDYVNYEIAKLLKEKGFDVPCIGRYSVRSKEFHLDCTRLCNNGGLFECATPTIQMAMKWLREIHGLNVQVFIVRTIELKKAYNVTIYSNTCEQLKTYFGRDIFDGFKSYEEACEAAIKYCLENLV